MATALKLKLLISPDDGVGTENEGRPLGSGPITETDKSNVDTRIVAPTTAISTPGTRGEIRRVTVIAARHPMPTAAEAKVASSRP